MQHNNSNLKGTYVSQIISYFQRSGRTGRAKDEGVVVSIFSKDDIIKNRKEVLVNTL